MVSRPDQVVAQSQSCDSFPAPPLHTQLSPETSQRSSDVPSTSPSTPFVPNKVEKCCILQQLTVLGAPSQKGKTLEKTCASVASSAKQRHDTDQDIVEQQTAYGMSWRRSYMASITPLNVLYIASSALKQACLIAQTKSDGENGIRIAAVRQGGKEGDAQHNLDQALIDYKTEAEKKVVCSDDSASKILSRRKESRKEKMQRLAKRKLDYEAEKKDKEKIKKKSLQERPAADRQLLRAQTMNTNAAVTSIAVAARQTEQFGAFLALYAQKNNLSMPQMKTSMPNMTSLEPLERDSALLAEEPVVHQR